MNENNNGCNCPWESKSALPTEEASPQTESAPALVRNYKDSVFRLLFNDKERALELYNAISGSSYGPDTPFRFTTLEEVILQTKKNDISFLLEDFFIIMVEHQSTLSENLPIRYLLYYAATIQRDIPNKDFYRLTGLKIPRPTFIVLYNGTEDCPDRLQMQLSDSFRSQGKNDLQLNLTVYNINQGRNQEIMNHCRTLQEYSRFVAKMRKHIRKAAGPLTEKELDKLLQECIGEGILTDFLKAHGTEVISMLFTEMTEEEARELAREDGYERGRRDGQAEGNSIGDANARCDIARNMKAAGMDSGEIVKLTGLTLEEVLAL